MHVHSARCTRMFSQIKNRGGKICTKVKPTDGLPENQDEDIDIHSASTYNYGKKNSLSQNNEEPLRSS